MPDPPATFVPESEAESASGNTDNSIFADTKNTQIKNQMSRFLSIIFMCCAVLASCQRDEELPAATPTTDRREIIVTLRHDDFPDANASTESDTRSTARRAESYDHVEYCVTDESGSTIGNIKGIYDASTSEMKFEGLHEGRYNLLLFGIRGDWSNDGVTIRRIAHIDDTWVLFPEELGKPLDAEYFYSRTPFAVTALHTAAGEELTTDLPAEIVQRRVIGRTDFAFLYNNTYVRTAVQTKSALLTDVRFRTELSGGGEFSGRSSASTIALDLDTAVSYLFPPTAEGDSFTGQIELTTRNYRGTDVCCSYTFDLAAVEADRIARIDIRATHPDDESVTMFLTERAYAEGGHSLILQDGESKTVYTDPALRSFNTAQPLQVSATDDGRLHVRFYSPRVLNDVLIRARIPVLGDDFVDLACFDQIPAFADFYETLPLIRRKSVGRTEAGQWISIPQMTPQELDGIEFKIESKDPYWEKLRQIIHGWNISFNLYGGDPDLPDGGPVGNWMGIRPVHCREVVALFLNFTYMIDMPEHEEILRANEDRLYGNGGVSDKVTAETVLRQMRQERTLRVGLVYPGNGIVGLGGGNVFGAYQQCWLQHYFNTYSCEVLFHELGHVMGYNHSSSFTYGPWAQELMNRFYVNHIDQMPIDRATYLNSSQNPNLYP